ncbi:MAG TPA: DUF6666 family protein, partial [Pirellulales bacterium]
MHSIRAAIFTVFAAMMSWGLLAATAGAQPPAPSYGAGDPAWRSAAPNQDNRARYYDDGRSDGYDDRRPAPPSRPAPRPDQANGKDGDRSKSKDPPPPLRGINTSNPRPRDTQEWRTRRPSGAAQPTDQRAEAPRTAQTAATRDDVRQTQYQDDPRKPAASSSRSQSYEWHPDRGQAPRAAPPAQSEAPLFNANAPAAAPTLAPVERRASAPPPEYRAQENRPQENRAYDDRPYDDRAPDNWAQENRGPNRPAYREEADQMAYGNRRPAPQRSGEPMFFAQNQRPRGPYRPTSATAAYELPPGAAPYQAQPENVQGVPSQRGPGSSGRPNYQDQTIYQDHPIMDGSSGGYDVDANGYPADGYGYGGGYNDGYGGPGGYYDNSECYYNCGGPCDYCSTCCGGPSCPHRWFEEANIFAGVHSFQGGLDRGQSGNFGFQEGINFAGSLWHRYNIGYQIGGMFAQSDLSGNIFPNDTNSSFSTRQQSFVTAGVFRRALCGHGIQGGIVFDWLDDRYYTETQYTQIRAEASYLYGIGHEVGFWGAFGTGQTQQDAF